MINHRSGQLLVSVCTYHITKYVFVTNQDLTAVSILTDADCSVSVRLQQLNVSGQTHATTHEPVMTLPGHPNGGYAT